MVKIANESIQFDAINGKDEHYQDILLRLINLFPSLYKQIIHVQSASLCFIKRLNFLFVDKQKTDELFSFYNPLAAKDEISRPTNVTFL